MFGLNMNSCYITSINNHAEALAAYERGKPQRSEIHGDARRIPGKEGSRVMDVRIKASGSVAFRYHYTDVVTWHKDDTCSVDTYPSDATCRFADRFIPKSMWFEAAMRHLVVGATTYAITGPFKLNVDGPIGTMGLGAFKREVVNRRRARALLATTRYAEYRAWYDATWPMVRDTVRYVPWASTGDDILEALTDDRQWFNLLEHRVTPADLRAALYSKDRWTPASVYDTETRETLPQHMTKGWAVCRREG
jgi:hypothetical protein